MSTLQEAWAADEAGRYLAMAAKKEAGWYAGQAAQVTMTAAEDDWLAEAGLTDADVALAWYEGLSLSDEQAAEVLELAVSQAKREQLAKTGAALPDGSWPIHDLQHLATAKGYYHQGKTGGHSKEEIRKHINARARALGGEGLDDDEDDDSETTKQNHQGPRPKASKSPRHATKPVQVAVRVRAPTATAAAPRAATARPAPPPAARWPRPTSAGWSRPPPVTWTLPSWA